MDSPKDAAMLDIRTLFELESAYVWRSLRSLGVHANDLDDAMIDVFVAVNAHLGEFDATRRVRPWLFGFAARVASQWRRKAHARYEVVDSAADRVDESQAPDAMFRAREARRLVDLALEGVAPERRDVLLLHELEGCSLPEIARALEIPLGTATSRLRVAREEFARALLRIEQERPKRSSVAPVAIVAKEEATKR